MSRSIRFWGVRGSVPAPLTGAKVHAKVAQAIAVAMQQGLPATEASITSWMEEHLPFIIRSTFGGNTSCVEVRCGEQLFINDMGTGLRELGVALLPQMFRDKGIQGHILCSHVHWDHIQGFPFWAQLYFPRTDFDNRFTFHGGLAWKKSLEEVLRGQMNEPVFPVAFEEINLTKLQIHFATVFDGWTETFVQDGDSVVVQAHKLNHPQETYGYRIEHEGHVAVYTTDHEPYAAGIPDGLLRLVRGADVWITDCQYADEVYTGEKGGLQRMGWGHSYPSYIAAVARNAQPKRILTFHHDPASSDEQILALANQVGAESGIPTEAAYEGLEINF